jgi:P27 family predicted phage terminase small subunit
MRGGKKIPTALKIIRRNPGKRPLPKNEPMPVGDLKEPPDWMTESQKAGWTYAIENAPAGLLKKLDRSMLTAWVVSEDLHRRASQHVEQFGMLTKAPNTGLPIQSPYLPVLNKQAAIMIKSAEHLGFSPASRIRIQVAPGSGGGLDDEWDELDRMRDS